MPREKRKLRSRLFPLKARTLITAFNFSVLQLGCWRGERGQSQTSAVLTFPKIKPLRIVAALTKTNTKLSSVPAVLIDYMVVKIICQHKMLWFLKKLLTVFAASINAMLAM